MSRILLVALVAFAIGGCNKDDPGPTCTQVVDHMNEVTKNVMMNAHSGAERNTRALDLQYCEGKHYSRAARDCLIAAKDLESLAKCRALMPKPAGSGG